MSHKLHVLFRGFIDSDMTVVYNCSPKGHALIRSDGITRKKK